jgi:hydroxyacylglutathione hydrolase
MPGFVEIAPSVWRLSLLPLDLLNVYLLGDLLVDSGLPWTSRRLTRALEGRTLSAHVLTHAHPDHQGASHAVCEARGIPLWCGGGDREAVESGNPALTLPPRASFVTRTAGRWGGPAHPVARVLRDGDRVSDFAVVESPGHTPGHLSFWRETDRVLILGDVLFHRNPVTLRHGLQEPLAMITWDVATNRASARKLAALEPALVCFGHGEPLVDGERFTRFVSTLP